MLMKWRLVLLLLILPHLAKASELPVFVMVSGMANQIETTIRYRESVSYYYLLAKGLRERALDDMVEITPSLSTTAKEFSELLKAKIEEVKWELPRRPIVLIGHSRGAPFIMEYLLSNPQSLVDNSIGKVIFIQGALNGSLIGSVGLMTTITSAAVGPPWINKLLKKIPGISDYSIKDLIRGFSTVTHGIESAFKYRISKLGPEARAVLNKKILYIRSYQPCSDIDPDLKLSCLSLAAFGKNDGLLLLRDQMIDGVGRIIADIETGHMDLLFADYDDEVSKRERIEFGSWIAELAFSD
jgi:pimeloyl-ACP methyl ester carboxylesterase